VGDSLICFAACRKLEAARGSNARSALRPIIRCAGHQHRRFIGRSF
jgi:hypothetical protein